MPRNYQPSDRIAGEFSTVLHSTRPRGWYMGCALASQASETGSSPVPRSIEPSHCTFPGFRAQPQDNCKHLNVLNREGSDVEIRAET